MEVAMIKLKKSEMELAILQIVQKFEDETETTITEIDWDRVRRLGARGDIEGKIISIKTVLKIL